MRVAGPWRVLDQDGRDDPIDAPDRLLEVRTNHDHHGRTADDEPLQHFKNSPEHPRSAEREVGELLRQAGVHVVQVWHPKDGRQNHADETPFLVRVDRVVPLAERPADDRDGEEGVERNLCERGADPHLPDKGGTPRAKHPETRDRDVLSERIRHQINGVSQLDQRADTVELAERRTPRLEEGLRSDHQDFHGVTKRESLRDGFGEVNVTLADCDV